MDSARFWSSWSVGAYRCALVVMVASCGAEPPAPPPPGPPLPPELAAFDPEIRERIQDLAGGIRTTPGEPRRWLDLGMLYQAHGRLDLAAECYREARKLGADGAQIHYYLALADHGLGRVDEAIAGLRRMVELDDGYPPARRRLGLWLLEAGDPAAAARELEAALARTPGDPATTLVLARARLQAGEAAAAAALLEEAVAAAPGNRYAHFLLGRAYRRLGRVEEAERHLALGQGAEPVWPDPWADELDGLRAGFGARLEAATEQLGVAPAEAVAELERLRRARPDNVTALINLGIGYRLTGALERSDEVLAEAAAREPGRALVHFHLAATRLEMSRGAAEPAAAAELLERALADAARALELQPTSPRSHALMGELLARAGRVEAAVESYREAVRDPRDPAWLHRLGALLCESGRWGEAIPVLESFIARAGDEPTALFLLGAAQANAGRRAAAIATLERARLRAPGDARILDALEKLRAAH